MRKPTMWFPNRSDKPSCTSTENGKKLEILDLDSRGIVHITICLPKTKALISAFIFASAKCWFSHATAKLLIRNAVFLYLHFTTYTGT